MENQETKSGEYTSPSVGAIKIDGKFYNASPIGSGDFHFLRNADYGEGFRQGTYGEQLTLLNQACLNQNKDSLKYIVDLVEDSWISGDTALLGRKDDILVMNNPKIKGGRIHINPEELEDLLIGSKKLYKGVEISSCGNVGRISRKIIKKGYNKSSDEIRGSLHPYIAFLTLNPDSLSQIDGILKIIGKPVYVQAPLNGKVRVPDFGVGVNGLEVDGYYSTEFFSDRYSFGVHK